MQTRLLLLVASLITAACVGCAAQVDDPTQQGEATATTSAAESYDQCYQSCASSLCDGWSDDDPALPSCTLSADDTCSSQCSGRPAGGGGTNRRAYPKER
jgi:hypothetical protein